MSQLLLPTMLLNLLLVLACKLDLMFNVPGIQPTRGFGVVSGAADDKWYARHDSSREPPLEHGSEYC